MCCLTWVVKRLRWIRLFECCIRPWPPTSAVATETPRGDRFMRLEHDARANSGYSLHHHQTALPTTYQLLIQTPWNARKELTRALYKTDLDTLIRQLDKESIRPFLNSQVQCLHLYFVELFPYILTDQSSAQWEKEKIKQFMK